MSKKTKLILMRHGQSFWNQRNIFTGWVDIPLTEKGVQEAMEGGKKIQDIPIDVIFTSSLIRAQMTAFLAMIHHHSEKVPVMIHKEKKLKDWGVSYGEKANESTIPVFSSWHLNERMYGKLQGLNKDETRAKYGKEQVHIWRRSYEIAPPDGESLELTSKRTLPYFKNEIVPFLKQQKNVFISAHGNSLRSIIMYIDNMDKDEIVKLEIATGDPLIYEYSNKSWKKIL
jgi:2,3-bisphosphoglycerate-dependent phosphoglycerate mutase